MRYPSKSKIEGLPALELAVAVLHHMKHVTLPRVRGEFDISQMKTAHEMIEGLEAWISNPTIAEREGKTQELTDACIVYAMHNFPR